MHRANTHLTAPRIYRATIPTSHAPRYAPWHLCSSTEATDKTRHSHGRACASDHDNRHNAFSTTPVQAAARLTRCRAEVREIEMHRSAHIGPAQYRPMPQTPARAGRLAWSLAQQCNQQQTTSEPLFATAAPNPQAHLHRPTLHPQQLRDRIGSRPIPPHAQFDRPCLGMSIGSAQFWGQWYFAAQSIYQRGLPPDQCDLQWGYAQSVRILNPDPFWRVLWPIQCPQIGGHPPRAKQHASPDQQATIPAQRSSNL